MDLDTIKDPLIDEGQLTLLANLALRKIIKVEELSKRDLKKREDGLDV